MQLQPISLFLDVSQEIIKCAQKVDFRAFLFLVV
jgi:hypothetical protein